MPSLLWFAAILCSVLLGMPGVVFAMETFEVEVVDSVGTAGCTSIDLDRSGNSHILYTRNGFLMYARRVDGVWTPEAIDVCQPYNNDLALSLDLDSMDVPHVAYTHVDSIKYAFRIGEGTWQGECIDAADGPGHPSLVFDDASSSAHISYIGGTDSLRYAVKSGGSWTVETVDYPVHGFTALELTAWGEPHICYIAPGPYGLDYRHAVQGEFGWTIETVVTAPRGEPLGTTIDLSPNGTVHITYQGYGASGGGFMYAWKAGDWELEMIDTDPAAGYSIGNYPSLHAAPDGTVRIAFTQTGTSVGAKLAVRDPITEAFTISVVDTGDYCTYTSLAVDAAGIPRISYVKTDDLYFAISDAATSIAGVPAAPARTVLLPNSPNPFNPTTTIRYELVEPSTVCLDIYDVGGRLVRTLVDRRGRGVGRHEVIWDGRGEDGRAVASGVYFTRLAVERYAATGRMVLVR